MLVCVQQLESRGHVSVYCSYVSVGSG